MNVLSQFAWQRVHPMKDILHLLKYLLYLGLYGNIYYIIFRLSKYLLYITSSVEVVTIF